MRALLVPTDFSESAQRAVERAAQLAAAFDGAELILMHVVGSPGRDLVLRMAGKKQPEVEARIADDAEERLGELASQLRSRYGCTIRTRLSQGRPVREIVAAVKELAPDLVVMGARGDNPARDFLLGNTTDRVLRKVSTPILVVRRACAGPYARVLVAADFSPFSMPAANSAARLCPGAEMVLFHAYSVPFEEKLRLVGAGDDTIPAYREDAKLAAEASMEKMIGKLAASGVRAREIVAHGSPVPSILEHTRIVGADLTVVGKYGESMLGEMLVGSTTRRVVVSSEVDVLVTSESEELE
jgi:nucleotide-binding universal stress UspA family protein